jgi:aspartyl aminopeptidase
MLWDSKRAICSVPSLCIHLDRTSNEGFAINKETHLKPILATTIIDSIMGEPLKENEEKGVYNVHQ